MNIPVPIANGIRTDHPIPGLPFVDDSLLNLSAPDSIENIGRGAGTGRWGRTDLYNHLHGAWRAFTTDPTNTDYAWLVVHHPENGTSVTLYADDDVVKAYTYRDYENGGVMPLVVRNGGYWSDGTVWRRPTAVTDPVTHELTWDEPQEAESVLASSIRYGEIHTFFDPDKGKKVLSVAEVAKNPGKHISRADWVGKVLLVWLNRRAEGALPLERSILELTAPELATEALLNNQDAAKLAGVEASTWRAYVSRGTAPDPQKVNRVSASDKGRPSWSSPIVEAWVARRDRDLSSRAVRDDSPTDSRTETVLERISRTLVSLGRRVFKADGTDAIRHALQRDVIGIALRDHTSSSMHSAWMVDEYEERWGLPDFVLDQVVSLIWFNSHQAEEAIRMYVTKGVERGYVREKLENALIRSGQIQSAPEYLALVERAVKPHWQ